MYGATAGQVGILRFEAATNQAVCGILPSNEITPEFLFYSFLEQKDALVAQATGNAQPNISQEKIRNTEIRFPPLPEQRRIVGILDDAFEAIATAKANTEKNLQNARAIFESHLDEVFTKRGPGWVEKQIGECFKVRSGEFLPAKAMVLTGSFNVCGGNGIIGRHDEYNLSGENIIIGRVGAKCGNVHRLTGDLWVTDNALYISDYYFSFDLDFLARLLRFVNLGKQANQTAQPVISYTTIREVVLNFPSSMSQQAKIASQIDTLEEGTEKATYIYKAKLSALESLKKSLLHQAFAGEL